MISRDQHLTDITEPLFLIDSYMNLEPRLSPQNRKKCDDQSMWRRDLSPWVIYIFTTLIVFSLTIIYLSSSLEARIIRQAQASSRSAADEVLFVTDSGTVKLMSLAYRQAAADVIWLRSIQYFVTHLLTDRRYPWLEHFVHQIIDLDQGFKQVYLWAGSCILYGGEVTPDKVKSSNRIYEEALKRFPNDYEPAYRLGMNYYSELRVEDPEEQKQYKAMGIAYFERAAQAIDAPPTAFNLLRGIAKQMGRDDVLFYALTDELLRVQDLEERKYLEARLEKLTDRLMKEGRDRGAMGALSSLEEARSREEKRRAERPYLQSLDYEWIFGQERFPADWRGLIAHPVTPLHTLNHP